MHPAHVPAGHAPVIEIDPETSTLTWHRTDEHGQTEPDARRVPWFASIGVLDYASASPTRPHPPGHHDGAVPLPVYGDPLIVRPDAAAVFWRAENLLSSAPIRAGRVDFAAAAPVDWAADPDRYVLIEHNLAQIAPVRTLDPPLHVVRVDASGRLSFARLVVGAEGAPVIGPVGHHYQPWAIAEALAAAAAGGLAGLAVTSECELRIGDRLGSWQVLSPPDALAALATAGFTVTGAPAQRPGLVSALATAQRRWTTGWYAGTRLFALARYIPRAYGGDGWYHFDQPGLRRVAVAASDDPYDCGDLLGVHGPADVETRPPDQRVYVSMGWDGGGFATPLPARQMVLCEPTFLDGPLPPLDHDRRWQAACRRCGAPMTSAEVGPNWVPYLHELLADQPGTEQIWCPAHPDTRRRPHAPVCRVAEVGSHLVADH
jgi:hypothetical protein